MAVPAALMLMTSGISRSAAMMTSVSSQSLRLWGCNLHPAMALIINARLLILLEAGKLILALSWRGALIVYFIFFLFLFFLYSSGFFYFSAFSIWMSLMLTAFSLAYRIGRSSSVSGISSHARVLGRIFFGSGIRGE